MCHGLIRSINTVFYRQSHCINLGGIRPSLSRLNGTVVISYVNHAARLWLPVMLFCLLSITHQGVRLWRKTYVVDMVEGNRRTDYVAVGNTLMSIFFFAVSSAVGCLLVRSLPEV